MSFDIQSAARRLLGMIDAPRGLVGTLAWPDIVRPRIRVFVDPDLMHQVPVVPAEFEGFTVEVEARGEVIAF